MEQITMTIEELDRLLALDDGDAALIFLSFKRGREPAIGEHRMLQARRKLASAGMLPSDFAERPSCSHKEIAESKLTDPGFRAVVDETERLLGAPLSPSSLQTLHSIWRWRGLPPGVILLLLYHCAGGKKPLTLRQLDKEAAAWEREGILDEEAAEAYIKKKEASRELSARVFSGLGICGREPSKTEKDYVASWLALGFTFEAIAIAYDRTVVNTGRLAWGYCDKILRRWHESGWHTPEQIESGDKKPPVVKNDSGASPYERNKAALRRIKGE
jgi:hypothetical protein